MIRRLQVRVAVLDGAFLNLPNPGKVTVMWRCAFIAGELADVCVLTPIAKWPWMEE